MQGELRALGDGLESWRLSIGDCRSLEARDRLTGLDEALAGLDQRLRQVAEAWKVWSGGDESGEAPRIVGESPAAALVLNEEACKDLSRLDRASLLNLVRQWTLVDEVSRRLLQEVRVLAGLEESRPQGADGKSREASSGFHWDGARVRTALTPAVCFLLGCVVWIFTDPPTGPSIPSTTATFGLLMVMTPVDPRKLLVVFLTALVVTVAPIYFFVMPALDNGFELLVLIFTYTFFFGCLGGISPVLRLIPIILFVMTTGISNDQQYSFMAMVDSATMFGIVLSILAFVSMLSVAGRPASQVLAQVRRFSLSCERILESLSTSTVGDRKCRALRLREMQAMDLAAGKGLPAAAKKLDYGAFSANDPQAVEQLVSALEAIARRIRALVGAHEAVIDLAPADPESRPFPGGDLRKSLQAVFASWRRLDPNSLNVDLPSMRSLADAYESGHHSADDRSPSSEQDLMVTYAMVGCTRGLVEAMSRGQQVVTRMNWSQWAEGRF